MSDIKHNERREFLLSALRLLVLGALSAGTGALMLRHGGERCINAGICRGCAAFSDCGLPQALSAKAALARGEGWQRNKKD